MIVDDVRYHRVGAAKFRVREINGVIEVFAPAESAQRMTMTENATPWEELWDGTDDWEFTSAANDTPEQLYAFWEDVVARSRTRLQAAR